MKKLLSVLCASAMLVGCASGTQATTETKSTRKVKLTIAAAASLENAFEDELIPMFEKANEGYTIEGVYDSSGKLQLQIEQGLDADVFFSAATTQMNALQDEDLIDTDSVSNVLENKLVLIKGKDVDTNVTSFEDIASADMIAVGDPEVVPAGQYAKEALTNLGVWDSIQDKVTLAGNVTEVLSQVETGNASVGLVYATDAASSDKVEVIAECDNSLLTSPVLYPVGRVSTTKHAKAADKLIKFLKGEKALKVFKKYGFIGA